MDKLLLKLEQEYIGKYDGQLRHILQEYSIKEIVNHIIRWLKIEWKKSDNLHYGEITNIAKDFYLGSNLTKKQKNAYYEELKTQGFFLLLNANLYANDFNKCGWTIYTIGKFSKQENAIYLEQAYEKLYAETNPILSQRSLNELTWLGSKKVKKYLDELHERNNIISKLTLLMYWESHCESVETDKLLSDNELIEFISPQNINISKNEVIYNRLFSFKNHVYNLLNENSELEMTNMKFEKIAKSYFEKLDLSVV